MASELKKEIPPFFLTVYVLLIGLGIFFWGAYWIDHETVYVGRKNLIYVSLFPSALFWIFKSFVQKYKLPGYKLIFYVVTFLWAAGVGTFFFLFAGIGNVELWLDYLASQVFYLGGWIVIFSVLAPTVNAVKIKGVVLLLISALFFVLINISLREGYFIREVSKYLAPVRLEFPQVFFEFIIAIMGIALYKLSLAEDKAAKMFALLSLIFVTGGLVLTNNGKTFSNYISYDYMFFAPLLLTVTLAAETILWSLYKMFTSNQNTST